MCFEKIFFGFEKCREDQQPRLSKDYLMLIQQQTKKTPFRIKGLVVVVSPKETSVILEQLVKWWHVSVV